MRSKSESLQIARGVYLRASIVRYEKSRHAKAFNERRASEILGAGQKAHHVWKALRVTFRSHCRNSRPVPTLSFAVGFRQPATGRGDLGTIDSEAFDFSQLEEYINDDNESNIYFHDALVTSSDLKLSGGEEKAPPFPRSGQPGLVKEPHAPHKNFRASDVTSSFNKP
ncbi:hypothetical protein AVEN_142396-1 [Araneus ventricosus]|uniref:Uncharacterized protein n=1 Tax=Araneus ventricosus TaxID=182803 RepID=A0A4Y2FGL4_ARAVE|nr:hypothetical protein AVEN_142396-1 [Araneus ventricosus]